jgi:hypothetical protein
MADQMQPAAVVAVTAPAASTTVRPPWFNAAALVGAGIAGYWLIKRKKRTRRSR